MFHQNDLQKLLVEEAEMNESKDSSMAQAQWVVDDCICDIESAGHDSKLASSANTSPKLR